MPAPVKHTFETQPLTPAIKRTGRPKTVLPPFPQFEVSEYEQQLMDAFIASHTADDMTDADHFMVFCASVEFVKLMRVYGAELASGEVISQARQHPGTMLNQYLDRLSITRKARERKPREEDDPNADALSRLSSRRVS